MYDKIHQITQFYVIANDIDLGRERERVEAITYYLCMHYPIWWSLMAKAPSTKGMVVNKSVSLPISVIEAILDEADLMHDTFSGTLVKLTKLGLTVRRDERLRDAKRQEDEDRDAIARIREASRVV
jgi:hypothetical protein